MSVVFAYIFAVFSHWLTLMSAGPFLIDTLLRLSTRGRVWLDRIGENQVRWVWPKVLLIGIFVAGFLAWKDEYHAREAAESRATKAEASQAKNQRENELRDSLRQFYVEAINLMSENTHLPPDISKEDLSTHVTKAFEWMTKVYLWAKQNLGDAAAESLREGQPTMGYPAAHGLVELNNLLNELSSFKDNIKHLAESKFGQSLTR
jgi:hypothetical protein